RRVPFHLPRPLPAHFDERARGRAPRLERAPLGFSFLRVVRFRGDALGRDRRDSSGLLLPDRALGRGVALLGSPWAAPRDRLDHGRAGLRRRRPALVLVGPADRSDDRGHLRSEPRPPRGPALGALPARGSPARPGQSAPGVTALPAVTGAGCAGLA